MNPHFKKGGFLIFCLLTAIALTSAGGIYFFNGIKARGTEEKFLLNIEKGEGLKEIAAALSRAEIIKSIAIFKAYAVLSGKARQLKPGVYELNGKMSVPEIFNVLIEGTSGETEVVIPEGATIKEIEDILRSAGVLAGNFLTAFDFKRQEIIEKYGFLKEVKNLEGFLYPDTYRFHLYSSAGEVAEKMLENFQKKNWVLLNGKDNWYEILIMASIVDKEVPDFEEQKVVAGVLNKRLSVNMPLQADATIVYAKCEGNLKLCPQRRLSKSDLQVVSPYNSYLNRGLPPTPIANVSFQAVQAVLEQKKSDYWFYLSASGTKKTVFARTLEEHNRNRVEYLR